MRRFGTPLLFAAGCHFLLLTALPPRAQADPAATPPPASVAPATHSRFVHVVAPSGIELQTNDPNGGFTVVCKSPCDTVLPTDIEYRAAGRTFENSPWFSIPDDAAPEVIEVRTASETAKWIGVLLIGVGAIAAGATFMYGLTGGGDDGGSCGGPSRPPCRDTGTKYGWLGALGVGAASALSGFVLLVANGGTKIVQTRGPLHPPDVTPPGPAASLREMSRREQGVAIVPALPSPGVVLYAGTF